MENWKLLLTAALLLLLWKGSDMDKSQPRGIRLNNPGNIRHGRDQWLGMSSEQPDNSFIYFESPEYGIRAMVRILQSYARRGVVSIKQIISTWAPPVENDTESYIKSVSDRLQIDKDYPLDLGSDDLPRLIAAIIQHENGRQPYDADTIYRGIELA